MLIIWSLTKEALTRHANWFSFPEVPCCQGMAPVLVAVCSVRASGNNHMMPWGYEDSGHFQ